MDFSWRRFWIGVLALPVFAGLLWLDMWWAAHYPEMSWQWIAIVFGWMVVIACVLVGVIFGCGAYGIPPPPPLPNPAQSSQWTRDSAEVAQKRMAALRPHTGNTELDPVTGREIQKQSEQG